MFLSQATVLLANAEQAKKAVLALNEQQFHGHVVGLTTAPPDSLLFVGNLPTDYSEEQFRDLMSPFGAIERLFLVRSELTGESKGYGFVEYINKDCAGQAKQQLMTTGSRYVGGRILRVDFAEQNLLTYEDLHSRTLFVDRLPRDFVDGEVFKQLFSQSGTVTFAQVSPDCSLLVTLKSRIIVSIRLLILRKISTLYGLIRVYMIINFRNFQLYLNLIQACTIIKI